MSETPTQTPQQHLSATARELFHDLLDLPAEQRADFLTTRTAGNPALREALESLLGAHDMAGAFMSGPTLGPDVAGETSTTDPELRARRVIGPYKLLQVIGEGGFGTVYLAEQEQPVRRRVALKLIKAGMDTRAVIARFEAERQALAMMDHPNIAKVFDAGATELGRPYFVMELVRGVPITEYCDQAQLTPQQRLELFIPICQAVQHAHQKGIIHRDLKPTNVLVTLHDGKPVPKVIDFGIAKATQQRLTEKTLFTEFRQMVGTPEYMSPEQAEMSGLDIDTRSDVYSLGVILYELLTGATPFDSKELRSKAFAEMQRVIREVDPPRPSTKLSTLETLPAVAAKRRTEPRKLGALVRGELDWIVMRCLEKDRTRRYESPSALAADVQRYLADEPVAASPPSAAYKARKFVRRHRAGLAVLSVVLLALVVGLVVALYGLRRAVSAERLARQRLDDVSREAAKSTAANQFLQEMITAADPFRAPSADPTLREMLAGSVSKIDGGAFAKQPEVEAALRTTMGRSFRGLGRNDAAIEQLRKSLEILRRLHGNGDHAEVAESLNLLGMTLGDQGQLEEAERVMREALAMRKRVSGDTSADVAESLGNLASILMEQGKLEEAESLARQAVAIDAKVTASPSDTATRLHGLAMTLTRRGKLQEAEQVYRQALEIETRAESADDPSRSVTLTNLASLLMRQGRFAEAEAPQREALRLAQASLPPDHPDVAVALNGLAVCLRQQGKVDEAIALFRQSLAIEQSARPDHPNVAQVLRNLAFTLVMKKDYAAAEPLLVRALQINRHAWGDDNPDTADARANLGRVQSALGRQDEAIGNLRSAYDYQRAHPGNDPLAAARTAGQLANALWAAGRADESDALFHEAIDAFRRSPQAAGDLRVTLLNYWDIPVRHGRLDEAETISREALSLTLQQNKPGSEEAALAQTRLAYVLAKRDDHLDEAETLARQALATREKLGLPKDGWLVQVARSLLGEILLRRGKVDEAAPLLTESYPLILRDPAAMAGARRDARQRMILLLEKQGKPDEAARLRAEQTTQPATNPATTP